MARNEIQRAVVRRKNGGRISRSEGFVNASWRPRAAIFPMQLFEGIYFDDRAGAVVLNPRRSSLSSAR
jgi:hypothetical protein